MFPTIGEYNQAIKNKGLNTFHSLSNLSFIAATLHPIKIFLFGSGAYAVVFKATENGKYFAVRCFLASDQETISRYKAISDYLKTIDANWKADIQLLENEILVDGKLFPVLKMDWVEGVLINQFVTANLTNPSILTSIQQQLVKISDSLEQNRIGHGDLQCGNIIVQGTASNFKIKLIDYDGMFVPALRLKQSVEKGRSEFQHPNRTPYHFTSDIDRFSFWVMLTALEALKFDISLWKEVMQGGFNTLDNFLFTINDFKDTSQSNLFNRLQQINIPSLNFYIDKLKWFCNNDVSLIGKPILFNQTDIGLNLQPWNTNYFSNSDNAPQVIVSMDEKITITSNEKGVNVLSSTFQKLGETPLQLDKHIYDGKTLLISNGVQTKRIVVSGRDSIVQINFTI